jgi:MerR family copper efflux transcriptional regulator
MNIGEAAKLSGVSAKMIRHYESINLIKRSPRTGTGYRTYSENDLHTLRFIRHSRSLGFALDKIRDLLSLWQDPERASADVKFLAMSHVLELDNKIKELTEMRNTLKCLVDACAGNQRPDCPILEKLGKC